MKAWVRTDRGVKKEDSETRLISSPVRTLSSPFDKLVPCRGWTSFSLSYSQLICRMCAGVRVAMVNKKDLHLQMARTQLLEETAMLDLWRAIDRWLAGEQIADSEMAAGESL